MKRHIATPTPTPIKKSVVVKKYYIKVGTFKDPSNAIKLVGDKGLHYKKIETDSGATRVLVGPYATRDDAKEDLDSVRKIAPDAFIYKGKIDYMGRGGLFLTRFNSRFGSIWVK